MEKVIIFSAPSGAGKTTITRYILEHIAGCEFSVSATTRKPRGHEEDGRDYHFLQEETFRKKIDADEFVEWEEVYAGLFYGTLKSEVDRIWSMGHIVLFDVDVKGGLNLKKYFGEKALSIFIMPPSIDVLEKRLKKRGTETEEAVKMRVEKAFKELDYYRFFDVIIMNDELKKAQNDAFVTISKFLNN